MIAYAKAPMPRSIWEIGRAYLDGFSITAWLIYISLVVVVVEVALNFFTGTRYIVSVFAVSTLVATLLLLAPIIFKGMVACPHFALLPEFRFRAALALLAVALVGSIWFGVFVAWYMRSSTAAFGPLGYLHIATAAFALISLYFAGIQLAASYGNSIPGVFVLTALFLLPVVLLELAGPLPAPGSPAGTLMAAIVMLGSVLFWKRLFSRLQTKPSLQRSVKLEKRRIIGTEWTWVEPLGNATPEVDRMSLLLTLPVGIGRRLVQGIGIVVIAPLASLAGVLVISALTEDNSWLLNWPASARDVAFAFAAMSILVSTVTLFIIGQLVATRSRWFWLRLGGARATHWSKLERCVSRVVQSCWWVALAVAGVLALTPIPALYSVFYFTVFVSASVFALYAALSSKVNRWPFICRALMALLCFVLLVLGAGVHNTSDASLAVLLTVVINVVLVSLALILRVLAKRGFTQVDWRQVPGSMDRLVAALTSERAF